MYVQGKEKGNAKLIIEIIIMQILFNIHIVHILLVMGYTQFYQLEI